MTPTEKPFVRDLIFFEIYDHIIDEINKLKRQTVFFRQILTALTYLLSNIFYLKENPIILKINQESTNQPRIKSDIDTESDFYDTVNKSMTFEIKSK